MSPKPPTYRERAIATTVNNFSALRDLVVDLAEEIDKLIPESDPPSANETDVTETNTETEGN